MDITGRWLNCGKGDTKQRAAGGNLIVGRKSRCGAEE